jgi:predicted site-specific integrase-resolvase
MTDLEPLLSTEDAADLLGVHAETLFRWRKRGYGPPFVTLVEGRGGIVRYRRDQLVEWVAERTKSGVA